MNPTQFFVGKDKDRELAIQMKDKYNLSKNSIGYGVTSINDQVMSFVIKALATKVLRKCRPNLVLAFVIATVEQCAKGVQMNWANFLLNEFLSDYIDA